MATHDKCTASCGGTDCDAPRSTLTTVHEHGFRPGDVISYEVRDQRWWRRLIFWLFRLGEPRRTVRRRVLEASSTTMTV